MSTRQLTEAILDGGVRAINFFNGRLLSGEDLTQERIGNRTLGARLGQAIGEGVAFGLEATEATEVSTPTSPVLSVASGLAINRQGQTLALADTTNITLVHPASGPPVTPGTFTNCLPPQQGTSVLGTGVYLFVVSPASGSEGRAQVNGLGNGVATCNTRYLIEGVQFRLIQLPLTADVLNALPLLRNQVASLCFGVTDPDRTRFLSDPLGAPVEQYGLLDLLRSANLLTACDVPLAVVCWVAGQGLVFIDLWSVRRRLTQPSASDPWRWIVGDRRRGEGEAMFLQFQDHIHALAANETDPGSITVTDRFNFLPPAGLVPIRDTGSPSGFNITTFFGKFASADLALTDGNRVRSLIRESLEHEPIDLSSVDKVQLYLIWDNVLAVLAGTSSQLTLLFASPTLPYRGVARFGSAHWNLSRFAQAVI
jgi:hypothetical protein